MRQFFSIVRKSSFVAILAALVGFMSLSQPVQAANIFEKGFWLSGPRYDGVVGDCYQALQTISSRFAEKERKFWNSNLEITGYAHVRETAFHPWANDTIPRRFCSASAMLNDGKARQVYYSVIEDGGFAGFDSGVEWCVVGLDRNWAYNPRCRAARP